MTGQVHLELYIAQTGACWNKPHRTQFNGLHRRQHDLVSTSHSEHIVATYLALCGLVGVISSWRRPEPADPIKGVSAHGETTGRRSASYLAAPWCPSAAASSSCSLCCELTRECVTSSDHGPRGLVASPLHCKDRLVKCRTGSQIAVVTAAL